MSIPITNQRIYNLQKYMIKRHNMNPNGVIGVGFLFCGIGLPYLYNFVQEEKGMKPEMISGKEIIKKALEGDFLAKEVFDLFLKLLGLTIHQLCACFVPNNGVVLCGNILMSAKKLLIEDISKGPEKSILKKSFYNSGSLAEFNKSIPFYFCEIKELGLRGCFVSFAFC